MSVIATLPAAVLVALPLCVVGAIVVAVVFRSIQQRAQVRQTHGAHATSLASVSATIVVIDLALLGIGLALLGIFWLVLLEGC